MPNSCTKSIQTHKATIALCLLAATLLMNCSQKKKIEKWNKAQIDSTISTNDAFSRLDQEMEIFSMHEKRDSMQKRSSGVAYMKWGKDFPKNEAYARNYNCRAYFPHSDTLAINIGIGTGFGGQGFVIRYYKNKFYTKPYYITDVIIEGEQDPDHEIVFQDLTLNKSSYNLGDSLYGNIEIKSIEIKKNDTIEHTGKGYFRTIISRYNF